MSENMEFSVEQLQAFVDRHDEPPVIAFYGGEPVLELNKIINIMEIVKAKEFVIQTNGTILNRIPKELLSKFHTILISIDGTEELTNYFRGDTTYDRALKGGQFARQAGFEGDLVARMSVTTRSDIFEQVMHLVRCKKLDFNHVHWQLDAMWDIPENDRIEEFRKWVDNSYNPGITKLIDTWIDHMEKGELLGIAPFLGITHSLLTDSKSPLRCGAGIDFFALTTDGEITACPIPPSLEFPTLGNVETSLPAELPNKLNIDGPCLSCDYLDICGGRCLYTNKTQYWGDEGFDLVCNTVKHLVDELRRILPRVKSVINSGKYEINEFQYPKMPNGVEVIP